MITDGWLKFHRKESWIWTMPATWFRVMFEILRRARWKAEPAKQVVDGKLVMLPQGACWVSIRGLAEDLKLNARTVKRALDLMLEEGFLTRQRYTKRTMYLVTNYARYQATDPDDETQGTTQGATHCTTQGATQGATPKKKVRREEGKKEKNRKERADRQTPDGAAVVPDAVVLEYPCRNGVGHLTQPDLDLLQSAFPRLDVLASCRAAMGWMHTCIPSKRWTTAGLKRGLHRWCQRDLDDGKNLLRVDPTGASTKAAPVWTPEMRAAAMKAYGPKEES